MSFSFSFPTVVLDVKEQQLTTTSATTVMTYTPSTTGGNYSLSAYFRVVTAPTTVTVTIAWTDATGAQSSTFTLSSLAVGSYEISRETISAAVSTAITVTVTAGTANQVFFSACLEKLSNG